MLLRQTHIRQGGSSGEEGWTAARLWAVLQRFLIKLAHVKREHQRKGPAADEHGSVHILIFGDSRPPFVVLPSVHKTFDFRVMRQNRRLKHGDTEERRAELENFHGVLEDISQAQCTDRVRDFFIAAYVRGACQTAHVAELEGSVAVMTKRRYRDAWNRVVCRRIARVHGHSLKIRSRVQAAHAKREWYKERHARVILRPYSHIRPSKG